MRFGLYCGGSVTINTIKRSWGGGGSEFRIINKDKKDYY